MGDRTPVPLDRVRGPASRTEGVVSKQSANDPSHASIAVESTHLIHKPTHRKFYLQFYAVFKKNVLLKKRQPCTTFFELLLPLIAIWALMGLYTQASVKLLPAFIPKGRPQVNSTEGADALLKIIRNVNYRLAFVPGSSDTVSLVSQMKSQFTTTYPQFSTSDLLDFATEGELEGYIGRADYSKTPDTPGVYAAVIVNKDGTSAPYQWSYSLRFNGTGNRFAPLPAIPNTFTEKAVDDLKIDYDESNWSRYLGRGFMLVQDFVENFALSRSTSGSSTVATWDVLPFPVREHTSDDFAELVRDYLALLFTLAYLWSVTRIVKLLVEEKENRIKEAMKIMGLPETGLWTTWWLTYALMFLFTSLLIIAFSSRSVYKHSDKGIILFLFLVFGMSVFSFCYMIASLFDRAAVAATVGAIIWLGSFFPYFAVSGRDISRGNKTIACLSAPVCFGLGASWIQDYESASIGVQNGNTRDELNNFSFSITIGMLIFDNILYMLLGVYFSRVLPSKYGIRRPWYFCCLPSFWAECCRSIFSCRNRRSSRVANDSPQISETETKQSEAEAAGLMEAMPRGSAAAIKVRNLCKVWDTGVVAVNNTTIEIYEGQVFALLGHNGAGKTTTINMLTGMHEVTSGDALVYGHSIREEMDEIRQMTGVCPQHNVLFDLLTVQEHLELFAYIKGVEPKNLNEEVDDIIKKVGLTEKRHAASRTLSGGQKRKLSVGIALIGGSKIVFLDEPTSGMDAYSRRSTWELIREAKKGRVIILTTHFMDEADQLGDRIAIMAGGVVKCCGSPLFLKSKYGVGYTMTLIKKEGVNSDRIKKLVFDGVPSAEVLTDAAGEISFRLPFESSERFPQLFSTLDQSLDVFGLDSYGISVTTLEEVFLRVARDDITDAKTALETKHRRRASQSQKKGGDDEKKNETDGPGPVPGEEDPRFDAMAHSSSKTVAPLFRTEVSVLEHLQALLRKRFSNTRRDKKVWTWQFLYPALILLLGVGMVKLSISLSLPSVALDTAMFKTPNDIPYYVPNSGSFPIDALSSTTWAYNNNAIRVNSSSVGNSTALQQWLLDRWKQPRPRYLAYSFGSSSGTDVTLMFNTTAAHGLPISLNLYNNLRLQQQAASTANIKLLLNPLPFTSDQRSLQSSLTALMIAIAFALIPASYIAFVVKERETKAKHQQLISGVDTTAYWLANYIWDMTNYLIPALLALIIVAIYNIKQLLGENVGAFILAMLLYGLSVAPFTYVVSFFFSSHTTAQNTMLLIYIMAGAILLVISIILDIIESSRSTNRVLKFFYRIIPNFCFGEAMANLIVRQTAVAFGTPRGIWDMEITGWPMLYMFLESIIYFLVVLFIEYVLRTPQLLLKFTSAPNVEDAPFQEDADIVEEKARVAAGKADGDIIRIQGLRKVYPAANGQPAKVAVKDLWLGIPEKEVFGFLGINGAGKTTTLEILTGALLPTAGTGFLSGMDIRTEQRKIRHMLGYCPQFDALIDTMTAREHLHMYCAIKGLAVESRARYVNKMIEQLGLSAYADLPAAGYSGGNKRKLSVGIALVGNPSIVFLDEPSSGMDPGARRFMWDLIASTMVGRSVVLTTHSMEECEALSRRIGIMVGGRLRCLGSSQHLKHRYGDGYQLDFNVSGQASEAVERFVFSTFPGAVTIEKHSNNSKFRVPRAGLKLGHIFSVIESVKRELQIAEYSVSETTLEQIFIYFARQQEEERGDVAGFAPMSPAVGAPMSPG